MFRSKRRSNSIRSPLATFVVAELAFLAGCGVLSKAADDEASAPAASPPLGTSIQPLRTRQGRAAQLLKLAREVGAQQQASAFDALKSTVASNAAPDADSSELPAAATESADAGAGDAGAEPIGPVDAGAPSSPEPAPEPPVQPPGLPRDIVEQSALPIYGLEAGVRLDESELWDRLYESPAVCFGEYHDVPAHHYAETRALDELAARAASDCRPFAVGYEMFQRPYQAPLSAFVAGELGEEEFLAQTEYATRWGYDFALYRPLLERTRDHELPALALNMHREITRKIARTGLESLTEDERALLPELVLDDAEHRTFIFGLFGVLPEHAEELGLESYYVAQTVWDETMADTSARWLTLMAASKRGRHARLLDFAGGAHCHQSAIPRRITRRTGEPSLSVHAVFESELADGSFTPEGYDVLVVLDD